MDAYNRAVIRLRRATLDDVPSLEEWDRDDDVRASSGEDEDDDWDWAVEIPREVDWRELLVAEEDGRPVGFIQIIDACEEESHYWGDIAPDVMAIDIWIGAPADRGRGIGARMMALALDRCFADDRVTEVVIDPLESNVRAIRFYQRLGFHYVETRVFGDDVCSVHRIARNSWASTRETAS